MQQEEAAVLVKWLLTIPHYSWSLLSYVLFVSCTGAPKIIRSVKQVAVRQWSTPAENTSIVCVHVASIASKRCSLVHLDRCCLVPKGLRFVPAIAATKHNRQLALDQHRSNNEREKFCRVTYQLLKQHWRRKCQCIDILFSIVCFFWSNNSMNVNYSWLGLIVFLLLLLNWS